MHQVNRQQNKRKALRGVAHVAELKAKISKDVFMQSSVSQCGPVSRRSALILAAGSVVASANPVSAFSVPSLVDTAKSGVRMVVVQASQGSAGFSDLSKALEWADRRVGECDLISCLGWNFDASLAGMNDVADWAHLKSKYVAVAGKQPRLLGPNGECDAYESSNGARVFVTDLGTVTVGAHRSNTNDGAGSSQFSTDIIIDDGADYSQATGAFVAALSPSVAGLRRGAVIYGPDSESLTQATGEWGYGVVATLNLSALRRDRMQHARSPDHRLLKKRIS